MSEQIFIITYLIILIAYSIGSIVMIYHIFTFGISKKTAIMATLIYLMGSLFLLGLLYMNLQEIITLN